MLLVTGQRAMKEAGVTERIGSILKADGIEHWLFDQITSDPDYSEVEQAAALAKDIKAECVIGCGGGSVLDAAKAIAVRATHPYGILEYMLSGSHEATESTLPMIAISATSGTGSHVGRVSVISDNANKVKRVLASDYLYPKVAICDPQILRSMPPEVTVTTGFDAFAQALEGFLSTSENPMGNLCALEAMRIIYPTLPKVLNDPDNLDLRALMSWADTLAGFSLATNAILIPHVLSMVLGGRYGLTHARAIAGVTVSWLRHCHPKASGKLAMIAPSLGCKEMLTDNELAEWTVDAIDQFIRMLGLDQSPKEYGVPEEDFDGIAQEAHKTFRFRIDMNPVPIDTADLVSFLQTSSEGISMKTN